MGATTAGQSSPGVEVNDPYEGLYKVALDEARRSVDDQTAEVDGLRGRAINFLAFIGAGTAFLVGGATRAGTNRDGWFYMLAIVSTVLSLVTLASVLLVLGSWGSARKRRDPTGAVGRRGEWRGRLRANVIIDHYINAVVPTPTQAQLYWRIAQDLDDARASNEKYLVVTRHWYRVMLILGILQLLAWTWLVWARG